jgi:histidinol-phosphate phosphatase family protein
VAQPDDTDLVILAGGKGTRLRERLGDLPKPMVDIGGKPLLAHQVEMARSQGMRRIVLLLQHGAGFIRGHFRDGASSGVNVRYFEETSPRGTAGAVLDVLDALSERFVVMYGDTMLDVDLNRFLRSHLASGAAASLFLHPNDHPHDSDLVDRDESGRITGFFPYPHPADRVVPNLVNAALYVVERKALEPYRQWQGPLDFARDVFPRMLADGAALHGYVSPEYIKDAGTPERVDRVTADLQSGLIAARSLRKPAAAVFLDRDGVIIREVNRVSRPEQLELLEGAAVAIRRLNRSPYRTVVITNQPVIARGDCDERGLRAIHARLDMLLGAQHAYLDALYYCPHHPDSGFPGERAELKIKCDCRKPATGLIKRALADLNLDLGRSWFVGDTTVDFATARNAGVRAIGVATGHGGRDARYPVSADFEFEDLRAAVDFILSTEA